MLTYYPSRCDLVIKMEWYIRLITFELVNSNFILRYSRLEWIIIQMRQPRMKKKWKITVNYLNGIEQPGTEQKSTCHYGPCKISFGTWLLIFQIILLSSGFMNFHKNHFRSSSCNFSFLIVMRKNRLLVVINTGRKFAGSSWLLNSFWSENSKISKIWVWQTLRHVFLTTLEPELVS